MKTSARRQSEYWDNVAGHIQGSDAPDKDLVGYHSPYDAHVRRIAALLLDRFSAAVVKKDCIAELGSGAGLNLRYFARFTPKKLLAFDCSSQLLNLARANLSSVDNIEFIQTSGEDIPVPPGTSIDLLFTVTVLQHITDPEMYRRVTAAMMDAKPATILIIEDTRRPARQLTPHYILRSPSDYISSFDGDKYSLVMTQFASLTWAARLFGLINRLFGLYKQAEGCQLPKAAFTMTRFLSPLAARLDTLLPGKFGMTAALFHVR